MVDARMTGERCSANGLLAQQSPKQRSVRQWQWLRLRLRRQAPLWAAGGIAVLLSLQPAANAQTMPPMGERAMPLASEPSMPRAANGQPMPSAISAQAESERPAASRQVMPVTVTDGTRAGIDAAAPPERIDRDGLLRLLRARSPALAAERRQIDVARADEITARAWPNPVVAFDTRRGERNVSLSQPLLLSGQRQAREAAARSGTAAAQETVRAGYAELASEAVSLLLQLQANQQRRQAWGEALNDLDRLYAIVAGQVEAGARSRFDLHRMSVERAALAAQLGTLASAAADLGGRLGALIGVPDWRPAVAGEFRPAMPPISWETAWPASRDRLPALRAALAQELAARSRIEAVRKDFLPVPSVNLGQQWVAQEHRNTVIGVSVNLPLFDRGEGPVARARAEAQLAASRREQAERQAQVELRRSHEVLRLRIDALNAYERDVLSQLPRLREMAEDAYRFGRGSVLELIDVARSVAERRIEHIDAIEQALLAENGFAAASGAYQVELAELGGAGASSAASLPAAAGGVLLRP